MSEKDETNASVPKGAYSVKNPIPFEEIKPVGTIGNAFVKGKQIKIKANQGKSFRDINCKMIINVEKEEERKSYAEINKNLSRLK